MWMVVWLTVWALVATCLVYFIARRPKNEDAKSS